MAGFEPEFTGDRSANCASTTARQSCRAVHFIRIPGNEF